MANGFQWSLWNGEWKSVSSLDGPGRSFADLAESQNRFDLWRPVDNFERPYEALGLAVPGSRYQVRPRCYPEQLPEMEFSPIDVVRKVQKRGEL